MIMLEHGQWRIKALTNDFCIQKLTENKKTHAMEWDAVYYSPTLEYAVSLVYELSLREPSKNVMPDGNLNGSIKALEAHVASVKEELLEAVRNRKKS